MSAAITLQITDGTTTVSLATSATNKIAEYAPKTRPEQNGKTFVESAKIAFRNTSLANVLTDINNAEILLRRAAEWQNSHAGARVYVVYQYDTTVSKQRAILHGGAVEYDRDALRTSILNSIFECGVIWEREQWELETEVEIPLLNGSIGAKATGGVTIYNHDDAESGHDDWVEVAAADATGVDLAQTRLEITASSAHTATTFFIGHGRWQTWTNFVHILEGESSAVGTPSAGGQSDCSNAQYLTTPNIAATDTLIGQWALTAAQALAMNGRAYRLAMRLRAVASSGIVVTPFVTLASNATAQETGNQITLSTTDFLQDLGILHIPPWLTGESNLGAVDIRLYGRRATTATLDIDYIALLPVDSWRVARAAGLGITNSGYTTFVDDGILDTVYAKNGSGNQTAQWDAAGLPIALEPNKTQRIFIQALMSDGSMPIAATYNVRLYARARKPGF